MKIDGSLRVKFMGENLPEDGSRCILWRHKFLLLMIFFFCLFVLLPYIMLCLLKSPIEINYLESCLI